MNGERHPDARLRLLPNESVFARHPTAELGSLVADLTDEGAEWSLAVELDPSDRTRPGEQRGGATPIEGFAAFIASGLASHAIGRLADLALNSIVDWVQRRRRSPDDPTYVVIYGPDGEPIREVYVDDEGVQPASRYRRDR